LKISGVKKTNKENKSFNKTFEHKTNFGGKKITTEPIFVFFEMREIFQTVFAERLRIFNYFSAVFGNLHTVLNREAKT
jgi:hypothetical protein